MNRMPGIVAVTTCSLSGFNTYGRRMVQSWQRMWPVPLTLFTEGFRAPAGVNSRPIEKIDWLQAFLRSHTPKPPTDTYRHDAKRFAFKTAAVIETALQLAANPGNRYLIWVDADCFWHESPPPAFIESLLPGGDEFLSWLWREKSYPEAGFVVYDLRHPMLREVMSFWRRLYETGALFDLPEWHDAWVLQWVMQQFSTLTPKNISGDGAKTSHPFVNGPLGRWGDHSKGQRKINGRTPKRERTVKDDVPYWR